ncbi:MAG: ethanolamine ammonia-lyase light chain EutC [Alphaproteobacteria bacterium]|nr:ethanolamine ammonia-lyase light chain EutC [Alphaproteobacteria bacterium]
MQADLTIILPEIVLSVYAILALLGVAYTGQDRMAGMLVWVTAGLFALLAIWIGASGEGTRTAFGGMFNDDGFARFAKVTILLSAAAVLVLIGERPGLSSPDSLGLYFTQNPGPGLSDARRNCISNVRPAGLLPDHAAARFAYLYAQAQVLGTSGVALKDNSAPLLADAAATSFLSPPRTE